MQCSFPLKSQPPLRQAKRSSYFTVSPRDAGPPARYDSLRETIGLTPHTKRVRIHDSLGGDATDDQTELIWAASRRLRGRRDSVYIRMPVARSNHSL